MFRFIMIVQTVAGNRSLDRRFVVFTNLFIDSRLARSALRSQEHGSKESRELRMGFLLLDLPPRLYSPKISEDFKCA